ncbi:MAG: methyltransferase domain-containing protein [Alphaproteobacteria bacterium]|nr:methyltransferase domain-containing protein [Alphaproteobacteria bacterium]
MSGGVFQDQGGFYDLFYESKDYQGECDFVEAAFNRFATAPIKTVLDLGCGTGGHVLPLSARGYGMTGVDLSQTMLNQARRKAEEADSGAVFLHGDVRDVEVGRTFDAVISMFAVMGYQAEEGDLAAAFATARRHLEPGGLFLFDIWNGAAVTESPPEANSREFPEDGGGKVIRSTDPVLDEARQVVAVTIRVRHVSPQGEERESQELHSVRYLFPDEAVNLLRDAGFETVHVCAFPDLDREANADDWNMSLVAKAV